MAIKNDLPVCFVSPALMYDVFLEEILEKGRGQVCDEMEIHTLGGVKKLPLYKGELEIKTENDVIKKQVYFASSKNMLSREYSLLLPSVIFQGSDGQIKKKHKDEGESEGKTA